MFIYKHIIRHSVIILFLTDNQVEIQQMEFDFADDIVTIF